ncbi:MAG: hypothetical protein IKX23_08020 [Treponema sp.]|nr:hypothetical protein [Treponema sp.]
MKKLFILLCAVSALSVTACKKDAKEIQKIIDILGLKAPNAPKSFGKNPPVINYDLFDHFYVGSDSAGTGLTLAVYNEGTGCTYNWYKGKPEENWQILEDKNSNALDIKVESDIVYYVCEVISADRKSRSYSTVCKIECGTRTTSNIGKIVMRNSRTGELSYSDTISYSEGGPIGIVCDVNFDGSPKTVIHYSQGTAGKWASDSAETNQKVIPFNNVCGADNYSILSENVSDLSLQNYPQFYYCMSINKVYDEYVNWYLPAEYEMMVAVLNAKSINKAVDKFPSNNVNFLTKTPIQSNEFWTSSMKSNAGMACMVKNNYFNHEYTVYSVTEYMSQSFIPRAVCEYKDYPKNTQ